jgi:hypothetical protein
MTLAVDIDVALDRRSLSGPVSYPASADADQL